MRNFEWAPKKIRITFQAAASTTPVYEWNEDRNAPKIAKVDAQGRPLHRLDNIELKVDGGRVENASILLPVAQDFAAGMVVMVDGPRSLRLYTKTSTSPASGRTFADIAAELTAEKLTFVEWVESLRDDATDFETADSLPATSKPTPGGTGTATKEAAK